MHPAAAQPRWSHPGASRIPRGLAIIASLVTLAACAEAPSGPLASAAAAPAALNHVPTHQVFMSGANVKTWDPIIPATGDPNWTTSLCTTQPQVGPTANWVNPHNAFVVGGHPWAGYYFSAPWINAWNSLASVGPLGQSWTKYQTTVAGNGSFVIRLLADNCSWVYLDGNLVAVQPVGHTASNTSYGLTLNGTHTLDFIIFDGGGAAGGKFILETTTNPPPPLDAAPPVITPTVTGTLGTNGWYTSNVAITWTVTDAGSGVASKIGCDPSSVTSDTDGINFTCTAKDVAGNSATKTVTVKRDATPPVVLAALQPINGDGDFDDDSDDQEESDGDDESEDGYFRVAFSCSDGTNPGFTITSAAINGVAVTNGQIVELEKSNGTPRVKLPHGSSPLTIKAGAFALVVTCVDRAGNVGSATAVPVFPPDDDHDNGKDDNDDNDDNGRDDDN